MTHCGCQTAGEIVVGFEVKGGFVLRKYRNIEPDAWRKILNLVRWQLDLRVRDFERAQERGLPQAPGLRLLQDAYGTSRFLHRFLGYGRETTLERRASRLLREAGAGQPGGHTGPPLQENPQKSRQTGR